MALRSQVARQNIRWRYKASSSGRRRGARRWPWAILSLLIIVAVGMFVYNGSATGGGDLAAAPQDEAAGSQGADATSAANVDGLKLPAPGAKGNSTVGSAAGLGTPANKPLPADRVWTLDGGSGPVTAAPASKPLPAPSPTPEVIKSVPTPIETFRTSTGSTASTTDLGGGVEAGFSLIEQGKRVQGRKVLSKLLQDGSLTQAQAQKARDVLTIVNNTLIYSPRLYPEEPLTGSHVVVRGDRLVHIAIQYKTPHQFIEKINGINADRIQLDQKLKVVNGPFHAIVSKSAFRMDVYLKDPSDGQMLYIRSFPVGLGEDDSTPVGSWVVRPRSKVINPGWTNPRTGESFDRDDPKNPVGEFWMGLEGVSTETATLSGYGIHGTVDQNSIGTQSSMGCIRLRDEDVAQVYYMFWEGETTVQIAK